MAKKPAKGAIPRKSRAVPPHIKAAADRAAARAAGTKPSKPAKPIDPPITPAHKIKGAKPDASDTSAPPRSIFPPHYYKPDIKAEDVSGAGRPTDYKPEYAEQAKKLCELGATDVEIADFFDISSRTLYRWKLEHEEFCQALKVGKEICDDRVERSLYQKATGFAYKEQQAIKLKVDRDREDVKVVEIEKLALPDTQASLNWLFNRRPKEWRNATKIEHSGRDGGPIEVSDPTAKLDLARWIAAALTSHTPPAIDVTPTESDA